LFAELAGSQRHRHCQIVFHLAGGTNVDLATIGSLLAQVAKLPQELRVIE
jgi:hypothetical protein